MNEKAIVILSGGLDSTVLLYWLKREGFQVEALSFDYGQRHVRELVAARFIAERAQVPHEVIKLPITNFIATSSQTNFSIPVPEGHYTEESMKATIVPNRNMIMLSIAGAVALSRRAQVVAYAAHRGDHAIYPDCRGAFIDALAQALRLADWKQLNLIAPFRDFSKQQIVEVGAQLGVPFSFTYSCYNGREKHCGLCGTCVERKEAFALARVPDPTEYERVEGQFTGAGELLL